MQRQRWVRCVDRVDVVTPVPIDGNEKTVRKQVKTETEYLAEYGEFGFGGSGTR